jgi:hypothetical protein
MKNCQLDELPFLFDFAIVSRLIRQSISLFGVVWFFWATIFVLPLHLHENRIDSCKHASDVGNHDQPSDEHHSDHSRHHDCQVCRYDGQFCAVILPVPTVSYSEAQSVYAEHTFNESVSYFLLARSERAPPSLS